MIKSKTMSQVTNLSSSDKPMAKRPSITSQLASIAKVCPICGQSSHAGYTPFCSARCADVDLNRWNKGVYKL